MSDIVAVCRLSQLPHNRRQARCGFAAGCSLTKRRLLTGPEALLRLERLPELFTDNCTYKMADFNWRTLNIDALDPESSYNFDLATLTPAVQPVSTEDVQTLSGQIKQLMRAGQAEEALKGALENPPYGADEQGKVRQTRAHREHSTEETGCSPQQHSERLLREFLFCRMSTSAQSPRFCSQYGNRK